MAWLDNIKMFFEGAFDMQRKSTALIAYQYEQEMEEFLILCFSDILGVELPTTYYALELYPYVVEELEKFQRDSHHKKSIWEARGDNMGVDP